ncbi:unnamed protein product, partial [Sphenostylis stenocarpa]
CGDYPSIPLIGLKGCIAYSPKVAMRQLMRTQTALSREELGGLCFFGDPCTVANSLAVRRAWEKPVFMGDRELGKARVSVSSEYEEWRRNRGMSQPSAPPTAPSTSGDLQSQVNALT